jgi:hypothetical protein
MPLLLTKFIVPTNRTLVEKDGSWMNALLVQMEDLIWIMKKKLEHEKKLIISKYLENIKKMIKTFKEIRRWGFSVVASNGSKN